MSGGHWFRDIEIDLKEIQSWGASVVLTLLESHEIADLKVARLGTTVHDFGITWHWLEIKDGGIPEGEVVQQWASIKPDLISRLRAGERVFIHCKGGLGRTGTLATELLVSFGEDVASAMQRVRLARPGAIETKEQEEYLLSDEARR